MAKARAGPLDIIKNIYNDEFQWSLVKGLVVFALGVRIAKEFVGVEIMPKI